MRMSFSFCKVLVLLFVVSIFQWQALSAQKVSEEFEVQNGPWWTMNSNEKAVFSFADSQGSSLYVMAEEIKYASGAAGWKLPPLKVKYSLIEYDSLLNKVREELLFETNDSYEDRLFSCREYGGAYWCFFRRHIGTSFSVYARRLDLKAMKLSEEKKLISDTGKWKEGYNNYGLSPLKYTFNEDGEHERSLFFVQGSEEGDSDGHAYLTFQVLDQDLHLMQRGRVNLSVAPDLYSVEDIALRSDGTAYALVKTRTSKKVRWHRGFYKKQKEVFWELITCRPDGRILRTPIDAHEKRILYDMKLFLNESDGELICLGSYRDFANKYAPSFSGIFVGNYGLEQDSFLVKKHQRIAPEAAAALIWGNEQGIIKAYENGEHYGQVDVVFIKGFLREDGGFILEYVTAVPETTVDKQPNFTHYGVAEVPIGGAYLGLSPSGEIEWIHKLNKRITLGRGEIKVPFFRSKVFPSDDKLYFFFATSLPDEQVLEEAKTPVHLVFYYLDTKGVLSDIYLLNEPPDELTGRDFPNVKRAISVGDDVMLFLVSPRSDPKTYRWVKVHYLELAKYQRL